MAPNDTSPPTRAGYVALIGLPNAGKSSLMNRLVDQPLSIVTPLAQTTRAPVVGIDTRDGVQMIFVDTPGLVLRPAYLLHRAMLHTALERVGQVDATVLLVDAAAPPPDFPDEVLSTLRRHRQRLVVALNKRDAATPAQLQAAGEWAAALEPAAVVAASAVTGEGVGELRGRVAALLPELPFLFPEDEVSSQPVRFFVAEFIREAVLRQYQQEIPHSIFAEIEEFREERTPIFIRATIYVERDTQKRIIIGHGGAAIRELGRAARLKIEEFVGAPVYLDLWVKVLPKWRRHAPTLRRLGFTVPDPEA